MSTDETQVGDVFQINERHGRAGWVGAFVLTTEVKPWGIQGFVAHVVSHEEQAQAYIRLPWDEIDRVGRAPLVPGDPLIWHVNPDRQVSDVVVANSDGSVAIYPPTERSRFTFDRRC